MLQKSKDKDFVNSFQEWNLFFNLQVPYYRIIINKITNNN